MNDLSEPRALRADVPLPGSRQLAPQRVLLTAAFQDEKDRGLPEPARRRLSRRRIVLATAVATALTVTGGIVVSLPDHSADRDATPRAAGGQLLSARASADTLQLAAATVEKIGASEPRPKQWVYVKETVLGQTSESWTRWDGTGSATLPSLPRPEDPKFDPNKLHVWHGPNQEAKWKKEGYDDRSQRQFYDFLATLPSDPVRMMQRIRQKHAIDDVKGETPAQRDWREIDVLYRSVLIPPNAQAGLFRALANVAGARVEKGVKDPIGRPAIGVTVNYARPTASGWQGKQELFFDQHTYAYLGEIGHVSTDGNSTAAEDLADGATMIEVRNAWGVVDKPGERP